MRLSSGRKKDSLKWLFLSILLLCLHGFTSGQTGAPADSLKADSLRKTSRAQDPPNVLRKQYDFSDLLRNILHPGKPADSTRNKSGITVVPNVAANPTIGGQLGIKAVAGKRLGNDPKTLFSIGATSASITTKGIIYFYVNHNIFTPATNGTSRAILLFQKR